MSFVKPSSLGKVASERALNDEFTPIIKICSLIFVCNEEQLDKSKLTAQEDKEKIQSLEGKNTHSGVKQCISALTCKIGKHCVNAPFPIPPPPSPPQKKWFDGVPVPYK